MKKPLSIILLILGAAFLVLILPVLVIGYIVSDGVNEVRETYGYSDQELIRYVEKEHKFEVEIVRNEGREPGSAGLIVSDARVRQLGGEKLEFDIHISTFGRITGDTYKEVKQKLDLNQAYQHSDLFKNLKQLGFNELTFGEEADDSKFYMSLPENRDMADPETFQMLFSAIPFLKQLQAEVKKEEYELNEVSIHGATLTINEDYQTPADLGNKFASRNVDNFVYQFIDTDQAKIQKIIPILNQYGFYTQERKDMLECYEMVDYRQCHSYALRLDTFEESFSDTDFSYDNETDRNNLFKAIQNIQKIDLPIKSLVINSVNTPNQSEDQAYTREELKSRNEGASFARREVKVEDIDNIQAAEDITFTYE